VAHQRQAAPVPHRIERQQLIRLNGGRHVATTRSATPGVGDPGWAVCVCPEGCCAGHPQSQGPAERWLWRRAWKPRQSWEILTRARAKTGSLHRSRSVRALVVARGVKQRMEMPQRRLGLCMGAPGRRVSCQHLNPRLIACQAKVGRQSPQPAADACYSVHVRPTAARVRPGRPCARIATRCFEPRASQLVASLWPCAGRGRACCSPVQTRARCTPSTTNGTTTPSV
jgi:hypothetical protein